MLTLVTTIKEIVFEISDIFKCLIPWISEI